MIPRHGSVSVLFRSRSAPRLRRLQRTRVAKSDRFSHTTLQSPSGFAPLRALPFSLPFSLSFSALSNPKEIRERLSHALLGYGEPRGISRSQNKPTLG